MSCVVHLPVGAIVDLADYPLVAAYRWVDSGGYAVASDRTSRRNLIMHRLILGLEPGDRVVHHINEDKMDNRRTNLVICRDKIEAQMQPHPLRDLACGKRA